MLITQSDLEARLGRALTASEASSFTIINQAVQSEVERIIGSSVEAAELSYRYFDGGLQHLPIDPCTDVERVDMVDDDLTSTYQYDTTDYQIEPVNRTLKTMIRHRSGKIMTGLNNIRVQAKFSIYGDAGILAIVKNAMLEALVSEVDNNDNIKKETIEGYSVEFATTETQNAFASIKYLFPEV